MRSWRAGGSGSSIPSPTRRRWSGLRQLGAPRASIQLLDRHNRDCETLAGAARRAALQGAVGDDPGGSVHGPARDPQQLWREVALWWPERRALVVAEALGTAPAFALGDGAVGVHPMVRLTPPGGLRGLDPELLLVGHGAPVSGASVPGDVERAIARSRWDSPKLVLKLPSLIRDARR